jgi:hypothetical protein
LYAKSYPPYTNVSNVRSSICVDGCERIGEVVTIMVSRSESNGCGGDVSVVFIPTIGTVVVVVVSVAVILFSRWIINDAESKCAPVASLS